MPIDTNTPHGQLFATVGKQLQDRIRQDRLSRLKNYYDGEPPLPETMSNLRQQARDWFRTSRTNFAELVCEAPRERMQIVGIRTSVQNTDKSVRGDHGDETAWNAWTAAGLPVKAADVHENMVAKGDGYVIVNYDRRTGRAVPTSEDPAQVITVHDPLTDEVTEGMKLFHDQANQRDDCYLYVPGQVFVASKPSKGEERLSIANFNPSDWDWDAERSGPLPAGFEDVVPIVRFKNRGNADDGHSGLAEFERHIDVLDRINRTVLRGMVILTYQAFKQRAVSGELPERDDDGNLINYEDLLAAGPDALWLLPPDAKIWESGQVDMTPVLSFIKQDVLFLAAVTRTPLAMLTPDAAAQSAEGASLQREGLVFKTEDRIARASQAWSKVAALMFRFQGDTARADPADIQLMWAPVERYSLSEKANAIAQTKGVLSTWQQLTEVWGMPPSQAMQAMSELQDDLVLAQQYALGMKQITGGVNNDPARTATTTPGPAAV